jgi:Uncharacterised conserved protein
MLERYRRRRYYSVGRLQNLYGDLIAICLDGALSGQKRFHFENVASKFFNHDYLYWISKLDLKALRRIADEVQCNEAEEAVTKWRRRHLSNTFLSLSATRSTLAQYASHKVQSVSNFCVDEDEALCYCIAVEKHLIDVIRNIGELVVNAELLHLNAKQKSAQNLASDSLRSDEVFEFFCDKSILSWFVDIVKATPLESKINNDDVSKQTNKRSSHLIGATWSPKVKAQVFQSVGLLISEVRDESALFYILSQHCVNQLIVSVLPLQQFTTSALDAMMPAYVQFLKTVSFQISANPDLLFPLCSIQDKNNSEICLFPLYSSIIAVMRSNYAKMDSYVHASCLNLTVGLMQISHPSIQHWISFHADKDQRYLADHMCNLCLESYLRIVNTTIGPVVDVVRSKAIETQLEGFQHLLDALNDLFFCDVKSFNINLCESMLRNFIRRLLIDLLPNKNHQFFVVGENDADVIPHKEAAGQVATLLLSRLITSIKYGPLVRMLVVAILHPYSCNLFFTKENDTNENCNDDKQNEYGFTFALNSIIQANTVESLVQMNPCREEVVKSIRGVYGAWRVTTACCLLDGVLNSCHLDYVTLVKLEMISSEDDENHAGNGAKTNASTKFEDGLFEFLTKSHVPTSVVTAAALESISGICLIYLRKLAETCYMRNVPNSFGASIQQALIAARSFFYSRSLQPCQNTLISHSLVDIVDETVRNIYQVSTVKNHDSVTKGYSYQLKRYSSAYFNSRCDYLVRKISEVTWNEYEYVRFFVQMAFHFRAVCNIVDAYLSTVATFMDDRVTQTSNKTRCSQPALRLIDDSGVLSKYFYCLQPKPTIGAEIDINECMTFQFSTNIHRTKGNRSNSAHEFVLVLNRSDMFVVSPVPPCGRGRIVCCVPYFNIIAAATDGGHCLHVAIRNEDVHVEPFIKNGNIMFHFGTPGTCNVVKQYLDRSKSIIRQDLLDNVKQLLSTETDKEQVALADVSSKLEKFE